MMEAGWEVEKEKLICFMKLDDGLADELFSSAPRAFWRAFIVKELATGNVLAKFRYHQPDKKNWFIINPKQQDADTAASLEKGLRECLIEVLRRFGVSLQVANAAIQSFYPPDDGGNHTRTIIWLEQQDLITINAEKSDE